MREDAEFIISSSLEVTKGLLIAIGNEKLTGSIRPEELKDLINIAEQYMRIAKLAKEVGE